MDDGEEIVELRFTMEYVPFHRPVNVLLLADHVLLFIL